MKKSYRFLLVLLIVGGGVQAQYKMGVGVRFSTNDAVISNSISLKYFLGEGTAAEALLSFGDPLALGLLIQKHERLFSERFRWFYGGGGYVGFGGRKNVGIQGVIGLDYKLPLLPLNLSLDWKPELNLAKSFFLEPEALGLTARFTFK